MRRPQPLHRLRGYLCDGCGSLLLFLHHVLRRRRRDHLAIDYVVTDELPQLYVLEGHGEQELPQTFADQITKENIETTQFSLLTNDSVPEETDAVLIYEPQSDISEEEKTKLADYANAGGKLLVIAGPVDGVSLDNLESLLADYGVTTVDGVVVEASTDHYTAQPYILLPDMQQDGITDALIQENYYPNMPIAQGLVVSEDAENVVEVLTTSDEVFSKTAGYDLATYEKKTATPTGHSRWRFPSPAKTRARSSGSPQRRISRICTTRCLPAPMWI